MSEKKVDGLVSPSDIADIAGVSRGAVSNWRKRWDNFPQQVGGTDARPLFALSEVMTWLDANDRAAKHQDLTLDARLWFAASALRGQLDVTHLGPLVLLLACASKISRDEHKSLMVAIDELQERGLAVGRDELDSLSDSQVMALGAVLADVPDKELAPVVDSIFERSGTAAGKYAGEYGLVGSPLSAMLAELAARENAQRGAKSVYDPACGIGETIMQIVARPGSWAALRGQDINVATAMIARRRAFLRSASSNKNGGYFLTDADGASGPLVHFHISSEFLLPADEYLYDAKFDVVVAEPPFALRVDDVTSGRMLADPRYEFGVPPKTSADTAWLQLAIAHLQEHGVGYVVTSQAPLFRGGVERDIRREMVRRGCVRAIIQLPGKLYKHTSIPVVLWVLQRPSATPAPVLLIDASSDEVVAATELVAGWLFETEPITVPHRRVDAAELAAGDAVLTPSRWTSNDEVSAEDLQRRFDEADKRVRKLSGVIQAFVGDFSGRLNVPEPRILSVEALKREKVIEWTLGTSDSTTASNMAIDARERPYVVRASDVNAGWLPDTAGPSDEYLASDSVTEANDVLVTTWNRISAIVDDVGGRVLGNGVYRIRVRNELVLLPEFLAVVLGGSWNKKFFGGATNQRAKLQELEIPLIPIDAQSRVADSLMLVQQVSEGVGSLKRRLDDYEDILRDAVRYGIPLGGVEEDPETRR